MKMLYSDCSDKTAIFRGAATLFDLSGTGVFPTPTSELLEEDLEALRQDFAAISEDFQEVLRAEIERLKDADAG